MRLFRKKNLFGMEKESLAGRKTPEISGQEKDGLPVSAEIATVNRPVSRHINVAMVYRKVFERR